MGPSKCNQPKNQATVYQKKISDVLPHQVSKLSRRLEALASAVNQLNQNSNAAIGNRLKAEVEFLEYDLA